MVQLLPHACVHPRGKAGTDLPVHEASSVALRLCTSPAKLPCPSWNFSCFLHSSPLIVLLHLVSQASHAHCGVITYATISPLLSCVC